MKRFVCMLLTMLSVAFLLPSAIAAEPGKEDVYLRILGTNGTITTGVRTTYGGDIRVSDSVIQDRRRNKLVGFWPRPKLYKRRTI